VSFVLDASILVKLFRHEDDSGVAKAAIEAWAEGQQPLLAPHLIVYEVLSVALHYEVSFDIPLGLIEDMRRSGFRLVHPSARELRRAGEIARHKTAAHGKPPQLEDSIYHAMAIEHGGTFVTADVRHVEKTRHLGHVLALPEWRPKVAGRSPQQ
jgi:predicted nucleic acid-binding protein